MQVQLGYFPTNCALALCYCHGSHSVRSSPQALSRLEPSLGARGRMIHRLRGHTCLH